MRNRWQRTPPVARPLGGYSAYGVTLTLAAVVPGKAPALPATVTTTGITLLQLGHGCDAVDHANKFE